MSVISAINLTVHNTIFSNTAGTSPVRETVMSHYFQSIVTQQDKTRQTLDSALKEDPKQKNRVVFVRPPAWTWSRTTRMSRW
jgi:hypothetical protein